MREYLRAGAIPVGLLLFLLVVLVLTGCGQTKESVERDAQFAKVCKESGGHVWYNGWNQISCDFEDKK